MIKKIALLGLFLITSLVVRAQYIQPPNAEDCTSMFFKALLDEDNVALENILASDFSLTSFDGQLIDRNILMDGVVQGYLTVDSGMLSSMRTRNYGDVAVVTGNWSARGRLQNISFNNDLAYMVIVVKSAGNWKISAIQFTPVK